MDKMYKISIADTVRQMAMRLNTLAYMSDIEEIAPTDNFTREVDKILNVLNGYKKRVKTEIIIK